MANPHNGADCLCVRPTEKRKTVCVEPDKKAVRPRLIGVLPPSVIVGADKALE